jgi:hypothetical protein
VRVHDFPDPALGKAIPYGVYDVTHDVGWVSVGIDHDTAAFAVESLQHWWQAMGQATYPRATELLVVADGGGSNGSRNRLWKWALQQFADETGPGFACPRQSTIDTRCGRSSTSRRSTRSRGAVPPLRRRHSGDRAPGTGYSIRRRLPGAPRFPPA